ncbi:2-amino-4-hydroxy-6-hydroxymethyldihydropteridine diphosphokinase [Fodinibius salsisoli]|uniref:2-amino-4-hydroxy-6-hydroxymethyldihydropteridine pyrophosphokinase n=1 Tax=Fodinibius salsisoli TaxID=2820877 RepID=A0ABT3PNP2_9BACT|nr:2-amino-4-hydroxy-6-hydroxymethyldihydropteridine diphosphokinase [Fodinibius salsisoli]MCW9707467.1 2-amino-4-hydroxy-6-hydroxymethyldihydropteridine diphosphokinase [Fodinibius salsisoli]
MATVVVALGSNVGDRRQHLSDAKTFLTDVSTASVTASSIYVTEPIGPSTRDFYNAVVMLHSSEQAESLIQQFKQFEANHGRSGNRPRWSARTIDLDIISYGHLVIQSDNLIIPHPEYHKRLFVLEPLRELMPEWIDPKSHATVGELIAQAPDMRITKLDLRW